MPRLVIHDGVHMLHGDILLKQTLASVASRCIGMAPPSNSSTNMRMVFLVWPNGDMLMHSVHVDMPVCAGGHVHQLSTTCSARAGLDSRFCLSECTEWVGLHACEK